MYSGPRAPAPARVTLRTLRAKYARGEPLTMVTAYDYPSAVHVRCFCMRGDDDGDSGPSNQAQMAG